MTTPKTTRITSTPFGAILKMILAKMFSLKHYQDVPHEQCNCPYGALQVVRHHE